MGNISKRCATTPRSTSPFHLYLWFPSFYLTFSSVLPPSSHLFLAKPSSSLAPGWRRDSLTAFQSSFSSSLSPSRIAANQCSRVVCTREGNALNSFPSFELWCVKRGSWKRDFDGRFVCSLHCEFVIGAEVYSWDFRSIHIKCFRKNNKYFGRL